MDETKAQDLQEPLLGPGEDNRERESCEPPTDAAEESSSEPAAGNATLGDSVFGTRKSTEDALNACLSAYSKIGTFFNQSEEDREGGCTEMGTRLNACLNYIHLWILKGQFLSISFATLLAAFGGSLNFFSIIYMVTLLPLWTATVVFPVGKLYSDVRFQDLLPMVILMVILFSFGPIPDYTNRYATHLLESCMVSFFCLPGTLCAKKLILRKTPQAKGRTRAMALGLAVISFCPVLMDHVDDDVFWTLMIGVLTVQGLIVVIILLLGDSPVQVTSVVTVMYPCLPFRSLKEMEDEDQEAFQNQQEELEARLERQYAKLGGKTMQQTSQQPHAFRGQIQYPVIMGILVFWSMGFVLRYSQKTVHPLMAVDKESRPMHTTTIYPNVVSLDENSFKNALEQYPMVFVDYFSPYSRQNRLLAPTWEGLAELLIDAKQQNRNRLVPMKVAKQEAKRSREAATVVGTNPNSMEIIMFPEEEYKRVLKAVRSPIMVAKVSCADHHNLCKKQNIMSWPTLRLYVNGEVYKDFLGNHTILDLLQFVVVAEDEVLGKEKMTSSCLGS